MKTIIKLIRDTRGVGAAEYALIAMIISIAAIAGYSNLGAEVKAKYELVDQKLGGQP